jgi:hypothetical protein
VILCLLVLEFLRAFVCESLAVYIRGPHPISEAPTLATNKQLMMPPKKKSKKNTTTEVDQEDHNIEEPSQISY